MRRVHFFEYDTFGLTMVILRQCPLDVVLVPAVIERLDNPGVQETDQREGRNDAADCQFRLVHSGTPQRLATSASKIG